MLQALHEVALINSPINKHGLLALPVLHVVHPLPLILRLGVEELAVAVELAWKTFEYNLIYSDDGKFFDT